MVDSPGKVLSSSSPNFAPTGSKHAVTRTYPKRGAEQSFPSLNQGGWEDRPKGHAFTFGAGKSGQKQSI